MESDTYTEPIEEALDSLPKEVKDFLYKGTFQQVLTTIAQKLSLSEEQKSSLDYHLTRTIALIEHRNDLLTLCDAWNFSPEQKKIFVDEIEKQIFTPIIELTNYTEEDEEVSDAPSPIDVLESLKSRLTEAKSIAPSARSLDMSKQPAPVPDNLPVAPAKSSFDPYREIPGK